MADFAQLATLPARPAADEDFEQDRHSLYSGSDSQICRRVLLRVLEQTGSRLETDRCESRVTG